MSVRADAETLSNIPIFSECDVVHLQVMAFACTRQQFIDGEPIIRQGVPGEAAYLILNGTVDLITRSAETTTHLGSAGPGALLGEVAMIGRIPYSLTATAAGPVVAARIDRSLFTRIANEYPEFGIAVHRALARKLQESVGDFNRIRILLETARSFSDL
jgi:CRP-like cAMP-binding protein